MRVRLNFIREIHFFSVPIEPATMPPYFLGLLDTYKFVICKTFFQFVSFVLAFFFCVYRGQVFHKILKLTNVFEHTHIRVLMSMFTIGHRTKAKKRPLPIIAKYVN